MSQFRYSKVDCYSKVDDLFKATYRIFAQKRLKFPTRLRLECSHLNEGRFYIFKNA